MSLIILFNSFLIPFILLDRKWAQHLVVLELEEAVLLPQILLIVDLIIIFWIMKYILIIYWAFLLIFIKFLIHIWILVATLFLFFWWRLRWATVTTCIVYLSKLTDACISHYTYIDLTAWSTSCCACNLMIAWALLAF